jgi:hypothetical protein
MRGPLGRQRPAVPTVHTCHRYPRVGKAADHRGCDLPALKDFFSLERHQAKTLCGLLARLAAKICAYTRAQRINDLLGRPPRQLADLLV